jgi:hypothetical protein
MYTQETNSSRRDEGGEGKVLENVMSKQLVMELPLGDPRP